VSGLPPLVVVGNPGNRRITLLQAAAESLGVRPPRVLPWAQVLGGEARFEPGELVRIDSPGEDAEVARLLRGEADPVDLYRVEGTRAWYEGFIAALTRLHERIEAVGAVALGGLEDTAVAFDKARCHALLAARDINVPRAFPGVHDYESLLASRAEHRWNHVFVKIRHGSSASGVVGVRAGQVMYATTSVELHRMPAGYELYNSLRVRTYRRENELAVLFDRLGEDGLHVEQAVSKVVLTGQQTDFRLVTVGGRVTHAVGRSSNLPITNLHLGGRRRELGEFVEVYGEARWKHVVELAERTAACFPSSHCLGIDVLCDRNRDYVGEVNAYGDLLPNLIGLPGTPGEGVDTYTAQLRSLLATHA
jgi:glutathione synthase/RimK-type ligase-like ATP-grasp enzyme